MEPSVEPKPILHLEESAKTIPHVISSGHPSMATSDRKADVVLVKTEQGDKGKDKGRPHSKESEVTTVKSEGLSNQTESRYDENARCYPGVINEHTLSTDTDNGSDHMHGVVHDNNDHGSAANSLNNGLHHAHTTHCNFHPEGQHPFSKDTPIANSGSPDVTKGCKNKDGPSNIVPLKCERTSDDQINCKTDKAFKLKDKSWVTKKECIVRVGYKQSDRNNHKSQVTKTEIIQDSQPGKLFM